MRTRDSLDNGFALDLQQPPAATMLGDHSAAARRIAIAYPVAFYYSDPSRSSINIEFYYHALRKMGYRAILVCADGSECSDDVEWMTVPVERFKHADFWKGLGIDAAIFFTWLHYSEELRAMREAGVVAVSRADSDGTNSIRLFPAQTFDIIVAAQTRPVMRLRMLIHWLDCYLRLYKKMDADVLASLKEADVIAIETITARDRIQKILDHYKCPEVGQKIRVCGHLVAEDILDAPMPPPKRQKIVAIGRWNARQKDAPLLAEALRACLRQEPDTDVVLIGAGGEEAFAALRAEYNRVICTGAIPRLEIKNQIADAQVLALSSRFETFHIGAHEALCAGCTVVGPDVIPLPDICGAGEYGRIARRRDPEHLGNALVEEIRLWRRDERNPNEIAAFWRARLRPEHILSEMLSAASPISSE